MHASPRREMEEASTCPEFVEAMVRLHQAMPARISRSLVDGR